MSSTGRNLKSNGGDYYATPAWCARAIIPHLGMAPESILEPCAGTGAIVAALAPWARRGTVCANELVEDLANQITRGPHLADVRVGDYLQQDYGTFGLCITNPPYSLAQEFVERALTHCREVVMLLRLGFLGSQKRAPFWRSHPADVYVLPKRPSFTGKGTDSCDYAWFAWGPGRGHRWQVLDLGGAG